MTLRLRPMEAEDLALVERWLGEPHVARWYLAGSSLEAELDDIRRSVVGAQPVHMLVVIDGERPIGWCQWYPCAVDPAWAAEVGAAPDDCGIDYAIGDVTRIGSGVGTALIAALIGVVREARPGCAIVADPDARNAASRRVLEKNGFALVDVRSMETEPSNDPMAIYRLRGDAAAGTEAGDTGDG